MEGLLARSPDFHNTALMTLAIDQLRLGQVTDAQSTLLAHERTMQDTHASRWLQLTMETVLDLWHGRFAAAEARLFTLAAPIVARGHAAADLAGAGVLAAARAGAAGPLDRTRGLPADRRARLLRHLAGRARAREGPGARPDRGGPPPAGPR